MKRGAFSGIHRNGAIGVDSEEFGVGDIARSDTIQSNPIQWAAGCDGRVGSLQAHWATL